MEREERYGEKLDRLEQALRAAHRIEPALPPVRVEAVMARVRAAGAVGGGDVRFLWQFLSAAAVAAVLLLGVTLWNGASPDTVAISEMAESPWTVLVNPSVLN